MAEIVSMIPQHIATVIVTSSKQTSVTEKFKDKKVMISDIKKIKYNKQETQWQKLFQQLQDRKWATQ